MPLFLVHKLFSFTTKERPQANLCYLSCFSKIIRWPCFACSFEFLFLLNAYDVQAIIHGHSWQYQLFGRFVRTEVLELILYRGWQNKVLKNITIYLYSSVIVSWNILRYINVSIKFLGICSICRHEIWIKMKIVICERILYHLIHSKKPIFKKLEYQK